jgi:Flp pilus assembly protein TadD
MVTKDAIAQFKKAIDLEPNNASAHAGLSLTLANQGQKAEALREAKQAMSLDPKQELARAVVQRLNEVTP